MPKVGSDLSGTTTNTIPNGTHLLVIDKAEYGAAKSGNPMASLELLCRDGDPDTDDKRLFEYIMLGGKTQKGKPMPIGKLVQYINATHINWTCKACGQDGPAIGTHIIAEENGKFVHMGCHKVAGLEYDTDEFRGKRVKAVTEIEPGEEGRQDQSRIVRVMAAD